MAQQAGGISQLFLGDMRIALRGTDVSMTQQRGDGI